MNYYEHHIGDYAQATAHLTWLEDAAYSRLLRRYYATEKPLPVSVAEVQRLVGARTKWERQAVANVLREFFDLQEDGWHNARADAEIAKYRARCEKARASIAKRWEAQKAEQQAPDAQADASATKVNDESACELTPGQRTSRHESESRKSLISQDQDDTNVSPSNYSPYTIHHTPENITPPSPPSGGRAGSGFAQQVLLCEPPPLETNQGKSRVEPLPAEPPGFARFWKAWPSNHRKAARGKCLQVWLRIKAERHAEAILAHVEHMKLTEDWRKAGGQFVPAPLVYLNQRRWEGSALQDERAEEVCGEYAGAI